MHMFLPGEKPEGAMTSKKRSQAKSTVTLSFHLTVLPVDNGYRLHVRYGEEEYMWPDLQSSPSMYFSTCS